MLSQTLGFIGGGQMARALAEGFVAAGLARAEQIVFTDPSDASADGFRARVPGAKRLDSLADLAQQATVIWIAVKPAQVGSVARELNGYGLTDGLVISIAAGVTLSALASDLPTARLVRVMPNTPCLVGAGASAYSLGAGATADDSRLVGDLLRAVGTAHEVDEKLLDAVTGLSGSGPAYVFLAIEALADGGVRMGLPRDLALTLAAQTVYGTAKTVLQSHEHPAVLKDRVASPGGTTIAGLAALEQAAVRAGFISAVEAATKRSLELH